MSTHETRTALREATVRLASRNGVRGITARGIATEAGVNQALVFYHFGGVEDLLRQSFAEATGAMVARYTAELEQVRSFSELHEVGLRLAAQSRADGSAALLAHAVSAAFTDPIHAELLADSLRLWRGAVDDAVRRVLDTHELTSAVDHQALSGAISAASIGMITIDALDDAPLGHTMASLSRVALIVDRTARLLPAGLARRILGWDARH